MNDHSTPSPSVKSNVSGGCQKDTIHTDTMFVESNSSGKRKKKPPVVEDPGAKERSVSKQLSPLCTENMNIRFTTFFYKRSCPCILHSF